MRIGSHVEVRFTDHEPLAGVIVDLDVDRQRFKVHYDDYNVDSSWLSIRVPTLTNRVTIL